MKAMVNTGKGSLLRCVMLGDGMVGKTSVIHSFLGYTLSPSYTATVFMDNYCTHLSLAGVKHQLQITDLSIEEDLHVRPNCQSSNLVTIVCYSVVDKDSYYNIKSFWLPLIRNINPKIPILLVATHTDLRCENNPNHVTEVEGRNLCNELNMSAFLECSAVQKTGISNVFEMVAGLSLQLTLKNKKAKVNQRKHDR
ncbi:cdc42 homolog [Saccostrea cucullata]|uniref:cdc42 homolog n=1 Tax=Saccostrea cuccullata TaxID=36930 RepID=UPI002ED17DE2